MEDKEVVRCALQIEKLTSDRSYGNIWTLLGDLDESQVTAEHLVVTDIVRVLYRLLRTCSDEGVRRKVKSLLSKWKRQYSKVKCRGGSEEDGGASRQEEDGGGSRQEEDGGTSRQEEDGGGSRQEEDGGGSRQEKDGGGSRQEEDGGASRQEEDGGGSRQEEDGGTSRQEEDGGGSRQEEDGGTSRQEEDGGASRQEEDGGTSRQEEDAPCGSAQAGDSGGSVKVEEELEPSSTVEPHNLQTPTSSASSSVRDRCAQLLLAALQPDPPDQDQASRLAGDIEHHVHELHRHSQVKYKTCVRSKVANLRNPENGHLRRGLLIGSLTPEAFARMSAREMASEELRQLREEYSSRGVSERQLPQGIEGTHTQKIRCKRCGGAECSVTQVSRGALFLPAWVRPGGADEDAMTFVTCSACGQQWYHSGWVCL